MEMQSVNGGLSPLHSSTILFTEMSPADLDTELGTQSPPSIQVNLEVQLDRREAPHRNSPLSPNQVFAKSRTRPAASSPLTQRTRRPHRRQLSVLVVDDVPDVTEMIGLFLKHAGYEVKTAASAAAALELASERDFDLVISDIGMPEVNGYELAEKLRALTEYEEIPMIAVTGYSEFDDRQRSLQAGFNAHLTKPIDPSQLLNLIEQLLS